MSKKTVKKSCQSNTKVAPNAKNTNGMYISEMHVYPTKRDNGVLKAFVRLVLNEQLVLSSLRLIEGKNGLFVAYPGEFKKEEEKNYPYILPLNPDLRDYINQTVVEEFLSQTPDYDLAMSMDTENVSFQTNAVAIA